MKELFELVAAIQDRETAICLYTTIFPLNPAIQVALQNRKLNYTYDIKLSLWVLNTGKTLIYHKIHNAFD